MIYKLKGQQVVCGGKTFTIGGRVHANEQSDYHGLDGYVVEIITDDDKDTGNKTDDIAIEFYIPQNPEMIAKIEKTFSHLHGNPKKIGELSLDYVFMAPEMLDVMPDILTNHEINNE
jgi:hypothetical protein